MVGSGSKDIDLFINYIPWMNLFVADSEYFRKNSKAIDGIARTVGGDIIKTDQKYGPNFMPYDFSGDRFVLSLVGDVADQLKERGVKVIEVATDDKDSLLKDFGGVRCVTNVLHDESLLPLISQHNEVTEVYTENHPGFV